MVFDQLPISLPPFLLIASFVYFVLREYRKAKQKNTVQKWPPGPGKLPLIGSIHHLAAAGPLPHRSLQELAKKYGDLMHLQLGEIPAVVVSSHVMAKEVLKNQDIAFSNRPEVLTTKIMFYDNLDIAFSPYGDYWRQMRKICMVELLHPKNVRSFCSIREDEVSSLIRTIQSFSGKPMDLSNALGMFTSSVVSRAATGKTTGGQEALLPLMKKAVSLAGGFDVGDLFPSMKVLQTITGLKPKLMKIHREVDQILENIVSEHRENLEKNNGEVSEEDLTYAMLRNQQSGGFDIPITTDHIKAIIFDMFVAGTETSSTIVEWAMSEMMRYPQVLKKAQAELRETFKGKSTIHENDIKELKYLKLVIKETLRLHPPFPMIPRECREECKVNGYNIPIKTKVIVNYWAIGRDPEYWHDALQFIPERFEDKNIDYTGHNFEFIPFGAGRRICPGMSFGIANVELPLAILLYHFNWKLPEGVKPEDLDMTETVGLSAGRKNSLYLVPTPVDP